MDTARRHPVTPKQARRDRAWTNVARSRAVVARMCDARRSGTRRPLDIAHQVHVLLGALDEWDRACAEVGA